MPRTVLSPEAMQEGIEAVLERRIPLGEFNDPEFDKKIEKSIQEKIGEGYKLFIRYLSHFFFPKMMKSRKRGNAL